MGLFQLRQVIARAGHALGLEFQQAQAIQRVHLLRVDQQQFFPDLCRPCRVVLGLPVFTLLKQCPARVIERGKTAAVNQCCKYPEGYGVVARGHVVSHIGCNFPSSRKW